MKEHGVKISLVMLMLMVLLTVISGCGIKANPVRQSDETAMHKTVDDAGKASAKN